MSLLKQRKAEQKKLAFQNPFIQENPVFNPTQMSMLYDLFDAFSDRHRTADLRQIVTIAHTLHLQSNYPFIFHGLNNAAQNLDGERVTFEQMVESLCRMLGDPSNTEGRRSMFEFVDRQNEQRLSFDELKKLSQMIGEKLTDQQIDEIIEKVAGRGKKDISAQAFQAYVKTSYDRKNSP